MSKNYSDIIKKYPRLYKHFGYFECGIGWCDLIDNLSAELEQLIISDGEDCPTYATQVKEKYGTLRFYLSSETSEMSEAISKATRLSSKTCEVCGRDGELDCGSWVKCRCGECK